MEIEFFEDEELLSEKAAGLVLGELLLRPDLLLCAATGSSPAGLYDRLVKSGVKDPTLFDRMRIIKLDEWAGVPEGSIGTCERYLRQKLVDPLGMDDSRYLSFASDAADPVQECQRIQNLLIKEGPIDLAILGLGRNGHLGFIEPGEVVLPHCHVAGLTEQSMQHPMMHHADSKPKQGMTLGMKDILYSKVILLIVSGPGKEEAREVLLSGYITTRCPASFLWLHNQVHCMVLK